MKKLSMLMVVLLLFFSVGCGGNDATVESEKPIENVEKVEETKTEDVAEPEEETKETEGHYPVTIESYNSKKELATQVYEKKPEKVLCVYQNSIETMLALGLGDHIVAASGLDHKVKPELEADFAKVNYLEEFAPDKETVIMMEPDMILSWFSYFGEKNLGSEDFWHERDIHTYISYNSGATTERVLENEYKDILNLGKIFDVEEKSEKIVNEIKNEVERVRKSTLGQEPKQVLILERLKDETFVYGKDTLGGDMVSQLGAGLVSVDGGKVGAEDLIQINPDVIFSVYMDRDNPEAEKEAVELFTNDPAIQSVNAIKNGAIHAIPLGEMYCSGIRTIDGITTFAKGIYPELYE